MRLLKKTHYGRIPWSKKDVLSRTLTLFCEKAFGPDFTFVSSQITKTLLQEIRAVDLKVEQYESVYHRVFLLL